MKKKDNIKPGSQPDPDKPLPSKVHATLTFELPDDEEMLELAVQSRKWRQVVKDLTLIVCEWRDTARTPAEADAYRSVNLILRDYLAESGLTLYPREHLAQRRNERLERYGQHLDALFTEGPARWREMMGKLQKEPEDPA